jgi:hypothetical protein
MRNILRLARGYLFRAPGRAALQFALVLPAFVAPAVLVPQSDAGAWLLDFVRTLATAAPLTGMFFRSQEVVSQPVSRRELWRAQWLLATIGVTSLLFLLRVVIQLLRRDVSGSLLAQSTLVDLFGCSACGVLAAIFVDPNKPRALQTVFARAIMFAFALAILFSASVWSSYLRAAVVGPLVSPAFVALGATTLALLSVGVYAVPKSAATVRYVSRPWELGTADRSAADRSAPFRLSQKSTTESSGRNHWIAVKLVSAALVGAIAVVCSAVLDWFDPALTGVSLTFAQRLAGQYVRGGDIGLVVGMAAVMSTFTAMDNLRLVRLMPISRIVIATRFTATLLVSLSASVILQIAAYRAGFGSWPATLQLQAVIGVACAAATMKTFRLLVTGRWLSIVIAGPVIAVCELLGDKWPRVPVAAAAVLGLAAVSVLMWLDVVLLARSSQLYRVDQTSL